MPVGCHFYYKRSVTGWQTRLLNCFSSVTSVPSRSSSMWQYNGKLKCDWCTSASPLKSEVCDRCYMPVNRHASLSFSSSYVELILHVRFCHFIYRNTLLIPSSYTWTHCCVFLKCSCLFRYFLGEDSVYHCIHSQPLTDLPFCFHCQLKKIQQQT